MEDNCKHYHASNGLTVYELKKIIKDWPEYNEETGEECEVWFETGDGLSSPVTEVWPLNKRDTELGTCADILFKG